jgi:predicted nucleic acid-binding protein
MVLAAAQRAQADYIVTSDRGLIQHATTAALTPADMLALIG